MRLDKENGNTHWQDTMDLELTQIHEYKVFKDTGKAQFHNGKVVIPDGFQKIRVHFERVLYRALTMIKRCPCSSLNSGPAMMHNFSSV